MRPDDFWAGLYLATPFQVYFLGTMWCKQFNLKKYSAPHTWPVVHFTYTQVYLLFNNQVYFKFVTSSMKLQNKIKRFLCFFFFPLKVNGRDLKGKVED